MKYWLLAFMGVMGWAGLPLATWAQPRLLLLRNKMEVHPYQAAGYLSPIPFKRAFFHDDKIAKEVRRADLKDGTADGKITFFRDTTQSLPLTKAIIKGSKLLEIIIENMPCHDRDSIADNQERIRCLTALYNALNQYNTDKKPDPNYYIKLFNNLKDFVIARNEDKLWSFCIKNANIYTIENGKTLFDGHAPERAYTYSRMIKEEPELMLKQLVEFATDTFAYTLIADKALRNPEYVFELATAGNKVISKAVKRTPHPFVKMIVKIADSANAPLKAFSFLGSLYRNETTLNTVNTITDSPSLYLKYLIALRKAKEPIAPDTYNKELQLRSLKFVREINSLHDTTDTVRFATLQCFTPQELYYIMVLGEEEIYTSSFLGTFKRMMGKMQPQTGSEFLDSLHHDYFRIFLKLCAGYNTLSAFLATMPDKDRVALITRFMANLQAGKEDSPEEAVDVADALGSINDTTLLIFLKQKIAENYIIADSLNSKKGRVIYALLDRMINLPQPDSVYARLTKPNLLLPNIKEMYYGALMNDSGMIYQQVFFFGDEDGQHSYEHFLDNFKNDPNWQINNSNKYWTSITAKKPHKITIYANNPLPEPEDDEAIARLCKFLADTGIVPTIVIHRGHSYHLPLTLTHLQSKNRIVILGSCGGYQNLTTVIGKAPDAQIVSSKQTGTMGVNDEILRFLNRCLLNGEDIKWADMWHNLEIEFNKKQNLFQKDKFTDYVPPHKNLGALFIKAYRNSMNAPE